MPAPASVALKPVTDDSDSEVDEAAIRAEAAAMVESRKNGSIPFPSGRPALQTAAVDSDDEFASVNSSPSPDRRQDIDNFFGATHLQKSPQPLAASTPPTSRSPNPRLQTRTPDELRALEDGWEVKGAEQQVKTHPPRPLPRSGGGGGGGGRAPGAKPYTAQPMQQGAPGGRSPAKKRAGAGGGGGVAVSPGKVSNGTPRSRSSVRNGGGATAARSRTRSTGKGAKGAPVGRKAAPPLRDASTTQEPSPENFVVTKEVRQVASLRPVRPPAVAEMKTPGRKMYEQDQSQRREAEDKMVRTVEFKKKLLQAERERAQQWGRANANKGIDELRRELNVPDENDDDEGNEYVWRPPYAGWCSPPPVSPQVLRKKSKSRSPARDVAKRKPNKSPKKATPNHMHVDPRASNTEAYDLWYERKETQLRREAQQKALEKKAKNKNEMSLRLEKERLILDSLSSRDGRSRTASRTGSAKRRPLSRASSSKQSFASSPKRSERSPRGSPQQSGSPVAFENLSPIASAGMGGGFGSHSERAKSPKSPRSPKSPKSPRSPRQQQQQGSATELPSLSQYLEHSPLNTQRSSIHPTSPLPLTHGSLLGSGGGGGGSGTSHNAPGSLIFGGDGSFHLASLNTASGSGTLAPPAAAEHIEAILDHPSGVEVDASASASASVPASVPVPAGTSSAHSLEILQQQQVAHDLQLEKERLERDLAMQQKRFEEQLAMQQRQSAAFEENMALQREEHSRQMEDMKHTSAQQQQEMQRQAEQQQRDLVARTARELEQQLERQRQAELDKQALQDKVRDHEASLAAARQQEERDAHERDLRRERERLEQQHQQHSTAVQAAEHDANISQQRQQRDNERAAERTRHERELQDLSRGHDLQLARERRRLDAGLDQIEKEKERAELSRRDRERDRDHLLWERSDDSADYRDASILAERERERAERAEREAERERQRERAAWERAERERERAEQEHSRAERDRLELERERAAREQIQQQLLEERRARQEAEAANNATRRDWSSSHLTADTERAPSSRNSMQPPRTARPFGPSHTTHENAQQSWQRRNSDGEIRAPPLQNDLLQSLKRRERRADSSEFKLRLLFMNADTNGDGYVSPEEAFTVLAEAGWPEPHDDDANDALTSIDPYSRGFIGFYQFQRLVQLMYREDAPTLRTTKDISPQRRMSGLSNLSAMPYP